MANFRGRRCPSCGEGTIAVRNAKGRTMPYKDAQAVVLPGVRVPMCDHCDEMMLDSHSARALDVALQKGYETQRRAEQASEIEAILVQLGFQQKDLEALLGLSGGYVSKMLRDEKGPSPVLYRFLHVLRTHPRETVQAVSEVVTVPARVRELVGV